MTGERGRGRGGRGRARGRGNSSSSAPSHSNPNPSAETPSTDGMTTVRAPRGGRGRARGRGRGVSHNTAGSHEFIQFVPASTNNAAPPDEPVQQQHEPNRNQRGRGRGRGGNRSRNRSRQNSSGALNVPDNASNNVGAFSSNGVSDARGRGSRGRGGRGSARGGTTHANFGNSQASSSNAGPSQQQQQPRAQQQNNGHRDRRGRDMFDPHMDRRQVESAVRQGLIKKGVLRNSKKHRRNGFVTIDGYAHDFMVIGNRDQNRALNGDLVWLEYLGEAGPEAIEDAKSGSNLFKGQERRAFPPSTAAVSAPTSASSEVAPPLIVDTDEVDDDEEEDANPRGIVRVVGIDERRPGQTYKGFLMPVGWRPGMDKSQIDGLMGFDDDEEDGPRLPYSATAVNEEDQVSIGEDDENSDWEDAGEANMVELVEEMNGKLHLKPKQKKSKGKAKKKADSGEEKKQPRNIYFKPCDKRAPLLLVALKDCPDDFVANFKAYRDKIFIALFDRWPVQNLYPFGKLGKMVGDIGNILVETEAILASNCIQYGDFSDEVIKCLPRVPYTIPEDEIARRLDLREKRIFTIDPETAKDLDDAVSCEVLADGNYKVGVHIADVSFFVKPGTALDIEAQQRATTTYLVQKAYPMLPAVLCEDLCSLNPGVDRLAFSVIWTMTPNAEIVDTWFGRTVIRSCIKMSYDNAQGLIDDKPWDNVVLGKELTGGFSRQSVIDDVKVFYRLSKIMRKRRFDSGALSINQHRLTFRLDDEQLPTHCQVYEIKDSNRLIEEFMLLANMSVAKKISDHYPEAAMLRCHPKPSHDAMLKFLEFAERFGQKLNSETSGALQQSILLISGEERRLIFQLLAIKPMQRAKYFSTGEYKDNREMWRHYALNCGLYTHFTSPIRRYADVIVHRQLQAALDEDRAPLPSKILLKVAKHCNTKKEDARGAQDDSAKIYLCIYLKQKEQRDQLPIIEEGIVMDFGERSIDVYVPKYALDRRVYLDDCGVVKVEVPEAKNRSKIYWPKKYKAIPPYASTDQDREFLSIPDGRGNLVTTVSQDEVGLVEDVPFLKHVRVRMVVVGRSPMDVKLYLVHPEHDLNGYEKFQPTNLLGVQEQGQVEPTATSGENVMCYLEETYEDVD